MRKIENKTQQSNRKHTFVASMAMDRTAATAKAMSTTTAIARTSVATVATSTAAANSRERQGGALSRLDNKDNNQTEFTFVTSSSGGHTLCVPQSPTAGPQLLLLLSSRGTYGQAGTDGV